MYWEVLQVFGFYKCYGAAVTRESVVIITEWCYIDIL